jgi:hypothetical protein
MSILIVLSCKALLVVFTGHDGTFFRSFVLVGKLMSLEVLEGFSALHTLALLSGLVVEFAAAGTWAAPMAAVPRYPRMGGRDRQSSRRPRRVRVVGVLVEVRWRTAASLHVRGSRPRTSTGGI